ncbi:MAG TPA: anti-sigma factor [Candidatus Limnocylindrales bacterium]|nr:anti-sigma factor [Candidatus Limnocylindrales bacterium]
MTTHEQYTEDLTLYALGVLDGAARIALERHLASCAECRAELERLRSDVARLALSQSDASAPARARERLLTAIANEPKTTLGPKVMPLARRSAWGPVGWVAAAAAVLVAAATWERSNVLEQRQSVLEQQHAALEQQRISLEKQLAELQTKYVEGRTEIAKAREMLAAFTAPGARHVTLVSTEEKPQPQGKAIYVAERANLLFVANNLPPLAAGSAYELWLIPPDGAPLPAGVFTPDAQGNAVVMNPPLPAGTGVKAFAVTVEPAGGSPAPTTKPMLVGAAT